MTIPTSQAVEYFLHEARARNLRPKTISAYAWALAKLPAEVPETRREIIRLAADNAGVLAPDSLHDVHRVWSAFWRWLKAEYGIPNLMKSIAPPRRPRTFPRTFSEVELNRLWQAAGSRRNRAMIAVAIDTGARLGELATLSWTDVHMHSITLDGKTGPRVVPISRRTQEFLMGLGDDVHIWTSETDGRHLSARGFETTLRRIARRAGLTGHKLGWHTFRHTFATEFLRAGGTVWELQARLGHSSIETTMIYVHMTPRDIGAHHEELTPLRLIDTTEPLELEVVA